MIQKHLFCSLLVCFLTNAAPCLSDPSSRFDIQTTDEPISVTADFITYDKNQQMYVAQGNVEIYQANRSLKADQVTLYEQTQIAQASGDVAYAEGEDTMHGDYLEVNFNTNEGQIRKGSLFYKKGNVHLTGEHLEKRGENQYLLTKGDLTTCEGDPPPWKISYQKADITEEGWAKVKGATFKVRNIPLLYTPYLIYPAKTKRQTGLLIPSLGQSSSEGTSLNNALFWAISENTDATFYLDLATKKGIGIGSEYRYINSEKDSGRFYGYYIGERKEYQDDAYEDDGEQKLNRGRDRYNLVYEGKKDFNEDFFLRAKFDLVSDRQYYNDYGTSIVERTAERTETTVFLTKHWDQGFSLVGDVEYNKDLLEDYQKQQFFDDPILSSELLEEDPIGRYPQITFSAMPQLFSPAPVYFSLDSQYANFMRDEGTEGSRVDINPLLNWPMKLSHHFIFETQAGLRETAYLDTHNKEEGEDFDDNRILPTFRASLSTKFIKIFPSKSNSQRRYRHTIEPEVSYFYLSHEDQDDLPDYDGTDRIEQQNRFTIGLTNRLMTKLFLPDGSSSEREMFFVRAGQFYDANTSSQPFSNSFLELRSRPTDYLYLKSDLEYDAYDSEIEVFNGLINIFDRRGDYLNFEYRYAGASDDEANSKFPDITSNGFADTFFEEDPTGDIEQINTGAGLALTNKVSVFMQNRQARHEGRTLETIWGMHYHSQCWGTVLTYRKEAATDGRESERKIFLEFFLQGIGRIGGFGLGGLGAGGSR